MNVSKNGNHENKGIYFAPMEGITGYVYRTAHAKHFAGTDRYYLPFIAVHATHAMKNKEKKDVSPANNIGLCAVPQVLTKSVNDFLWIAYELTSLGYREINLNFGCPSPTVTSKGKGAAMLANPDEMDRFLYGIFEGLEKKGAVAEPQRRDGGTLSHRRKENEIRISVKTRIGVEREDEWERIFEIYNRYPICELTVHARTMHEFYNGQTHIDTFGEILKHTRIPVCYNGNINTVEDYRDIAERFGNDSLFSGVMIGRGLIRNPALAREIRGGAGFDAGECLAFHDEILRGYMQELSGDAHVISKMKELWWYMGTLFPDAGKELKKVRKARTVSEYRTAVRAILTSR